MLDKKYQIFISSTYDDLIDARAKVRDAILSMMHFPVGMELFGAANEEQWQIISETIDSSDYYVLIIGQRYGSVMPDTGISFTEKEFRYALEKGVPILAFLLDDDALVKPQYVEKVHSEKLVAFKETVKANRLVEWWKTPDDLAQKVTVALYKQITKTKRPGWVRGDAFDIEKSFKTLTEISEKNQQLEEENKALIFENQRLKTSRKPKLVIRIAGYDEAKDGSFHSRKDNIRTDEDGAIHLKVGKVEVDKNRIEAEYLPVSESDLMMEWNGQVTAEEIKAYNEALPSKKEVEEYIRKYQGYLMIVDHGIKIIVFIDNKGTAKATDVSVTIKFPDEVLVFDVDKVKRMREPEAPQKPRDLQEIAYEREHKSDVMMHRLLSPLEVTGNFIGVELPDLGSCTTVNSDYGSVEINDNIVGIETKNGIVHTKYDWFGGLYIVPLTKGEYTAKVTMMCAEYEDPEETELRFICE